MENIDTHTTAVYIKNYKPKGLVDTILFYKEVTKISMYGKNDGVKLIGTLDYVTGNIYYEEHEE